MKNKSSEYAGQIFEEARKQATTPCEAKLCHGLAHLAEAVGDLHEKIDAMDVSRHDFKMALVDSVEARLKAVGFIPKK